MTDRPLPLTRVDAAHCRGRQLMPARISNAVLRRFRRDETAQDLIEYALLVGLVALVAVTAVSSVGETIRDVFWNVIAASIP